MSQMLERLKTEEQLRRSLQKVDMLFFVFFYINLETFVPGPYSGSGTAIQAIGDIDGWEVQAGRKKW